MGVSTGIAWANHTTSPWHGCAHATYTDAAGNEHGHSGCSFCYAEKTAKRNPGTLGVWGKDGTRVMSASFHANCRKWNRQAEKIGVRASVFPSICDPFEDWQGPILDNEGGTLLKHVGADSYMADYSEAYHKDGQGWFPITMSDLRRDLFTTIDACPMLDFLLLTKRPQNVRGMWLDRDISIADCDSDREAIERLRYRPNFHLLTSISTQADAAALIAHLLACRDLVPVLGVSAEPLLGEIDLKQIWHDVFTQLPECRAEDLKLSHFLNWVIIGNESKRERVGRLPGGTEEGYWRAAKSLMEQCRAAGVAVFHKQGPIDGKTSHDPAEWPAWARIQELPR